MSALFPFSKKEIYLIRHGQTEWSQSGQHTGLTDIPLTPQGEKQAQSISKVLSKITFEKVFSSPLQRALNTCHLSGYPDPEITDELLEWNYGKFEGLTSNQIADIDPRWQLFRDGCPEGESIAEVATRADRILYHFNTINGPIAAFTSGHFSRVLIARWLGLDASLGRLFYISPASITILGTEHDKPTLIMENSLCHLT